MGCPAKKVCNVHAGSALLEDEPLVARILEAVVAAVDVPVTLKIRTGPAPSGATPCASRASPKRPACRRSRSTAARAPARFGGQAEYETIAEVKSRVRIPVIANGDIDTPEDAKRVLEATGADGVMIGRAAQGRPWLFREIAHYLATGERLRRRRRARSARVLRRAPGRPVRLLRRASTACASRASTSAGRCAPAGRRGVALRA